MTEWPGLGRLSPCHERACPMSAGAGGFDRWLDSCRPCVRYPSPAPDTRASIPVMKAGAISIDTDTLRHDGQRHGRALLQGAS